MTAVSGSATCCLRPTDGRTATEHAWRRGAPVVLFDLALDFATCPRIAIAAGDQASDAASERRRSGCSRRPASRSRSIDDHPGLLVMRTVCMLANEAADAVRLGVASAADVDLAMRLGVAYPRGPLAWAEAIGLGGSSAPSTPWPRATARTATAPHRCFGARLSPADRCMTEDEHDPQQRAEAVRDGDVRPGSSRAGRSASRSRRSARASPAAA